MISQRNKQKKEEAERKDGEGGEGNRKQKRRKIISKNKVRLWAGRDVTHTSNNCIIDVESTWTQKLSSHIL